MVFVVLLIIALLFHKKLFFEKIWSHLSVIFNGELTKTNFYNKKLFRILLECVIVLWTANTERYTEERQGLNSTADEILASIEQNADEISPSNIFAVAAILEGAYYINGSPQNTLTSGIVELAERKKTFVGGDDFKSGQTKLKSALIEFLIASALKPESIVSYNHLGNNDGKNLSESRQFRYKNGFLQN